MSLNPRLRRRALCSMGLALVSGVACTPEPTIDGPLGNAAGFDVQVEVPFVTNRNIEGEQGSRSYGNELGHVSVGRCLVGLDEDDGLEAELIGVSRDARERLFAGLDPTAAEGIIVYIHGYFEDFERNCRRAAVFKHRLGAASSFLMFSWPANSSPFTYAEDVRDMERSIPGFQELVDALAERFGPERVSVVAHSLGSRAAIRALQNWPEPRARLRNLVLVASDVDRSTFLQALPQLQARVEQITVLVSDRDRPLRLSETFNGEPRLGQADDVEIGGVHLVDVTEFADEHFSGHVYHLRNPRAARIIRRALAGAPP